MAPSLVSEWIKVCECWSDLDIWKAGCHRVVLWCISRDGDPHECLSRPLWCPVRVAAVGHGDDADAVLFVADGVDGPVLAAAGAPEVVQWCVELLAESFGVVGDGPGEVLEH